MEVMHFSRACQSCHMARLLLHELTAQMLQLQESSTCADEQHHYICTNFRAEGHLNMRAAIDMYVWQNLLTLAAWTRHVGQLAGAS